MNRPDDLLRSIPQDVQGLIADLLIHELNITEGELWSKLQSKSTFNDFFRTARFRQLIMTERYRYVYEQYYSSNNWLLKRYYRRYDNTFDYRQAVFDITTMLKQLPKYNDVIHRSYDPYRLPEAIITRSSLQMCFDCHLDILFSREAKATLSKLANGLKRAFSLRRTSPAALQTYRNSYLTVVKFHYDFAKFSNYDNLRILAVLEKYYKSPVGRLLITIGTHARYPVLKILQALNEPIKAMLARHEAKTLDVPFDEILTLIAALPTGGIISPFLIKLRAMPVDYTTRAIADDSPKGFAHELTASGASAVTYFTDPQLLASFYNRGKIKILRAYHEQFPQLHSPSANFFVRLLDNHSHKYLQWLSEQGTITPFNLNDLLTEPSNGPYLTIPSTVPSSLFYRYVTIPPTLNFFLFYGAISQVVNPVTITNSKYCDFINDYRGQAISADDIVKIILRHDNIVVTQQLLSIERIREPNYRTYLAYIFEQFDLKKLYNGDPFRTKNYNYYLLYLYYHYLRSSDPLMIAIPFPFIHYRSFSSRDNTHILKPTVLARIIPAINIATNEHQITFDHDEVDTIHGQQTFEIFELPSAVGQYIESFFDD